MRRYNDLQMDNNRSEGSMNNSFDNNRSMGGGSMNRSGNNNMGNNFDNDNNFGFEDRRGFALPSFQNDMNQGSFGGNDRQSNNNSMGGTNRRNNNGELCRNLHIWMCD